MKKKRSLSERLNRHFHFLFTLPAVLLYLFFMIYPMLMGFYFSFTDWNGISRKYKFIGFSNFTKLFQDSRAIQAMSNTAIYAVLLVAIVTVLSLLIASLLNMKIQCRGLLRAIYFFPAVLSSITVGLIFNEIYFFVVPMIGKALGIQALLQSPLANANLALYAVLFINVWQGLALPIVMLLAGMQAVPTDLKEAAAIDGANSFQRFKKITLPLLFPTLAVVMILTFRNGLMVFDYIKATTDGGPGFATMTIAMLIYQHAFDQLKFSYSTAESFLMFLVISILAFVQFGVMRRKEML